ncbi:Protein of unknown function [Pyronema omphalodes CBS 100304]|uniref:Uncharacterized protein n=1 Tax=Pyronema omphalodes (strain CBS 100304) TaxID=1076935 RepID=U4LNT1_PYROM|nr:Protein of unknown function [Pyronema omphalodes CBS 100304]
MDGAEKLEKKYIALLEGKISSLEKELAEKSKNDSKKAPQENTKGTSTSNRIKDGETPAVKKKSRVRYLIRSYTETGEFTTQPCEEEPGKDGALSNEDSDELAISWRHTYEEQTGNGEKKRKFSFKELVIESTELKKALEEVVTKKYKDMSFNRNETSLRMHLSLPEGIAGVCGSTNRHS